MSLLRKRYDMIALLLQAAPKVHHNLPKAIIALNSPYGDHSWQPTLWQVCQIAQISLISASEKPLRRRISSPAASQSAASPEASTNTLARTSKSPCGPQSITANDQNVVFVLHNSLHCKIVNRIAHLGYLIITPFPLLVNARSHRRDSLGYCIRSKGNCIPHGSFYAYPISSFATAWERHRIFP